MCDATRDSGIGNRESGFGESGYESMPKVTFIIDGEAQTVEFEHGKVPYSNHGKPESFLDIAKHFGVHLEHACGGNCACTTCHVVIREGAGHISEMEDDEADRLDTA